jgi:ABC-2 type transport system permease protein
VERRTREFVVLFEMGWRELWRDSLATFFSFAFPLLFLLLFGVTNVFREPTSFKIGVINTHSRESQRLTRALESRRLVETQTLTMGEGLERLRDGRLSALLVFPESSRWQDQPLRLVADPRWTAVAELALDGAQLELARQAGSVPSVWSHVVEPPPGRVTNDFNFIFPGLIAMALLQLGLFATATPLLRARDRGTLRHLSTTPMSRLGLLMSQVCLRFMIACLQLLLLIGAGTFIFRVDVLGSWLVLVTAAVLGAAMLVALGYGLAGVAPSLESGTLLIMLVNFLMLFLGQVFFNLGDVPVLGTVVRVIPLTYLSDLLRQSVLGTVGLLPAWADMAALCAWTMIGLVCALMTFRFDMETR